MLAEASPTQSVVLVLTLALAGFVMFYRLGTATWLGDELTYRKAGLQYVHGNLAANWEHPFLAKYLFGFAQLLLGATRVGAVRLPSAAAGLATGAVLFVFARRVAGFWVSLLAFMMWVLLPHGIVDGLGVHAVKIERLALLEPVMGLFMILAVYLGWRWAETGDWRWVLLAGAATGLAAGSKATGVLVLPGVVVGAIWIRRLSLRSVAQGTSCVVVCVLAALATYLPLAGKARDVIPYMFAFQAWYGQAGHVVFVAGHLYGHPPWWSHLWWQWLNYGTPATVSLAAALGASLLLRPRAFFLYVLAAALGPFLYLSFFSGFKLAHYNYAWQPPLTLLVAVAIGRLVGMSGWRRLAAVAMLAPLVWLAGTTVARVATLRPQDYPAAAEFLRAHHATEGRVVVFGSVDVACAYLPGTLVTSSPAAGRGPVTAMIDDPALTRRFIGRSAQAHRDYLDSIRPDATRHQVDRLDVYLLVEWPVGPTPPAGGAARSLPGSSTGAQRSAMAHIDRAVAHLATRGSPPGRHLPLAMTSPPHPTPMCETPG